MNAHLTALTVSNADEIRELRARLADCEEAIVSLRRHIAILREAIYCLDEGTRPNLIGIGPKIGR